MDAGHEKPAILILADGMSSGGTERQIVELLRGLKGKGVFRTVFGVLVKGGEREEEARKYSDIVLPVRQSRSYDFTLAFSLINLVGKYHIDLIHTFGSVSDCAGIVAGKITGKPVINGSIRSARPRLNRRDRISRICMSFATWIVANSQAGLRAFGVEKFSNASVIYNGVDLNRFKGVESVFYGYPAICMVGNFTRKKDQISLIRALPVMQQKVPSLRLILVGRGETLDRCRQLSSSLNLDKSVHFFTDVNHPEQLIMGCQVGILLSPQGEGTSNVIIEYMAMGKPVIASDLGGNRELVDHRKTGLLVSDHLPETLSSTILDVLCDEEKIKSMGMSGREKIREKFGLERMINDYESLYLKVLNLRIKKKG